jgi:hypothetical protein
VTVGLHVDTIVTYTIVTYTAVLDVREGTVFFLARLLWLRRREPGTRRGRRALAATGRRYR